MRGIPSDPTVSNTPITLISISSLVRFRFSSSSSYLGFDALGLLGKGLSGFAGWYFGFFRFSKSLKTSARYGKPALVKRPTPAMRPAMLRAVKAPREKPNRKISSSVSSSVA